MGDLARELERRRTAAAAAWDVHDAVVLVEAGAEIPVPGRGDITYPFRSHSEYLYLTDRERPGGVLAFDPDEGWVDFVAPVTATELLWSGLEGDREGVPDGTRPVGDLEGWLRGRPARRLGAAADADTALRDALIRVRRPKDDLEVGRMRRAVAATRAGFAELAGAIRAGRTERELQILLEAAFLRAGGDHLAFPTIIAAGDHSAVLHFSPTARELRDGDLLLVDAGAECGGYAADVTRTYPVGSGFDAAQRVVWDTVRLAGEAAIAACRPGVMWHDVHRAAALVVAEGLRELGVLRGTPETLLDSGAVTLFLPHGVGHMVGLGIRDAGTASGETRGPEGGLPRLRVDIALEPRHAWTVEPGIYLVPAILDGARGRRDVAWDRVDGLAGFGGVRIEQDVLITADGCEVLTADIPLN
ncbi:MAG: aminopeptidase P N-terminal domain-containing protein [Thermoleophilia bacterium]|nr:aminopeptidase P N-terminal domain-containing protein [Thermoleophilia bacterium]